MARWNSANVLQTNAGGRRLWQLSAKDGRFVVQDEKTLQSGELPPPLVVGKDWQTLFRDKLNIAWLPASKVFLRAVQLPSSDQAELTAMVELQMEKISPLPVAQIVWSIYVLPRPSDKPDALQTVIVIIAARSAVEEFLGQLEGEGFLSDRLEAPGLEQFLAVEMKGDGLWVFPGMDGEPALVVWWYGATIHNLTLVALPAGPERGPQLKTQIEQIAWAGELEGWLTGVLKMHLVVGPSDSGFWTVVFTDWVAQLEITEPVPPKALAELSARRCASEAPSTSLLPPEFTTRYHQQFVDRLWMRSLVTVVAAYILGVLFYFGMLYVFQLKNDKVKNELAAMGSGFTNSQRDVEQISILKEREALKYAALDSWKAVAENLNDSLTLDDMFFQRGKLELRGTVLSDDQADVGTFNNRLRESTNAISGEPLFTDVGPPTITLRGTAGDWRFICSLKDTESP